METQVINITAICFACNNFHSPQLRCRPRKGVFSNPAQTQPKAIVIGRLSGDWVAMLLQSAEGTYKKKTHYIV